jgi:hypothetical protein
MIGLLFVYTDMSRMKMNRMEDVIDSINLHFSLVNMDGLCNVAYVQLSLC